MGCLKGTYSGTVDRLDAMDQHTGVNTEEDIAPNFWKWVLIVLCGFVLVAIVAALLFYFFRGRKENHQPPGIPQTTSSAQRLETAYLQKAAQVPSCTDEDSRISAEHLELLRDVEPSPTIRTFGSAQKTEAGSATSMNRRVTAHGRFKDHYIPAD